MKDGVILVISSFFVGEGGELEETEARVITPPSH